MYKCLSTLIEKELRNVEDMVIFQTKISWLKLTERVEMVLNQEFGRYDL